MLGRVLVVTLLIGNLLWTMGLVASPYLIPPNSVEGMDGSANVIDHGELWKTLSPVPRIVYAIGDLVCHQMEDRSLHANANQFPIDARLTGMFVSANVGLGVALWLRPRDSIRSTLAQRVPAHRRAPGPGNDNGGRVLAVLVAFAFVPVALDAGFQLATSYESTQLLRIATGSILGAIGGVLAGTTLCVLGESEPNSAGAAPRGRRPEPEKTGSHGHNGFNV